MCLEFKETDAKITKPQSHPSAVQLHGGLGFCSGVIFALIWLSLSVAQAQTTNYVLGTTSLLVGPAAGINSVVLGVTPATGTWTATPNATWLHLTAANQSGTGSTNVVFTYDANPSATRSGTLTIAGQTLAIIQAGSTYVAAAPVTILATSELLSEPGFLAVDASGNIYFSTDNAVEKWTASNNTVTTLVSSGLDYPTGVAVDGMGNVYIADSNNNAIKKWTAANSNVVTLVSAGLNFPVGVAVDAVGNVYFADSANNAIKKCAIANSHVITLVSSQLNFPFCIAVDAAGNVYTSDTGDSAIKEWTAADNTLATLISGATGDLGVAVDGSVMSTLRRLSTPPSRSGQRRTAQRTIWLPLGFTN
jgi:sugar lactone lactonase YvrE